MDDQTPLYATDAKGGQHVLMPMRLHDVPEAKPIQPQPTEPATPEPTPVTRPAKAHKEQPVNKPNTAIERLTNACDTAKAKLKEAQDALSEINAAAKDVLKEDKQRRIEIDQVRAGLAKLQTIKV